MKPLISVIVPFYNVEKYLPGCLDSLSRQSLSAIEILLIDDASSDNCGKICEVYAENDYRFKVFHNDKNRGPAAARNIGVLQASGDYLMFVDSDDWISDDCCQVAYECAIRQKADLVMFAYQCVKVNDSGNLENVFVNKVSEGVKTREEGIELTFESFGMVPWNKLYHKKLFNNVTYPEGYLFEDTATTYKLIWNASRIYCIENVLYYHLLSRSGSVMSNRKTVKAKKDMARVHLWHCCDLHNWGYSSEALKPHLISAALNYCVTNKRVVGDADYLFAEKTLTNLQDISKANSWKRRSMIRLFQFNRTLFDIVCKLLGRRVEL